MEIKISYKENESDIVCGNYPLNHALQRGGVANQSPRHQVFRGAHIRMMRSMRASRIRDEHISNAELFEAFKLPTIGDYITYKRLSWIGHAVRRGPNDRSAIAVLKALRIQDQYGPNGSKKTVCIEELSSLNCQSSARTGSAGGARLRL